MTPCGMNMHTELKIVLVFNMQNKMMLVWKNLILEDVFQPV